MILGPSAAAKTLRHEAAQRMLGRSRPCDFLARLDGELLMKKRVPLTRPSVSSRRPRSLESSMSAGVSNSPTKMRLFSAFWLQSVVVL